MIGCMAGETGGDSGKINSGMQAIGITLCKFGSHVEEHLDML